jgi:hypothetical protein
MKETWRAVTFASTLFWCIVGRAVEALISGRRKAIWPRVTLVEMVFAALFVCLGIVVLVGTITSAHAG